MKKIILVRHATATRKGPDIPDFTRSLRKKGRRETRLMIEWYKDTDETPDLFLSSPANRAIETARKFAKGLGYKRKKISIDKYLYGTADPAEFLGILKRLDDRYESVMVFGHDPAFTDFAGYMVRGFNDVLPKCGVFGFTVNRKYWRTIRSGDGRIRYFETPEGLKSRSREQSA